MEEVDEVARAYGYTARGCVVAGSMSAALPAAALEVVDVLLLALPRQLCALAVAHQPRLPLLVRLLLLLLPLPARPAGPAVASEVVLEPAARARQIMLTTSGDVL